MSVQIETSRLFVKQSQLLICPHRIFISGIQTPYHSSLTHMVFCVVWIYQPNISALRFTLFITTFATNSPNIDRQKQFHHPVTKLPRFYFLVFLYFVLFLQCGQFLFFFNWQKNLKVSVRQCYYHLLSRGKTAGDVFWCTHTHSESVTHAHTDSLALKRTHSHIHARTPGPGTLISYLIPPHLCLSFYSSSLQSSRLLFWRALLCCSVGLDAV